MRVTLLLALCCTAPLAAQTVPEQERIDALAEQLRRLRISGYIQPQYVDSGEASDFSVRRGRIKFTYQMTKTSRFVLQPDVSSSGATLKDGYVELIEPWTDWQHTVTAGQFPWPFGFEVMYSSSNREMPERSLVVRRLFPGERDRGVMLSGAGFTKRFVYRVAVVNGTGTARSDDDSSKDLVGRVGWSAGPLTLGLSGYHGSDRGFDKSREGIDFQWTTPLPGLRLRGEYIRGKQPPPVGSPAPGAADVDGWYVYLIQEVGSRHQFVVRADEYDAETETRTLGGSYIFRWDANSKVMLAHEAPDRGSDVWTLRYQFSF
ncbi:MAG TPA: porin [Thermoanaerobaculia bacterium]|nr:porin [Thermoanaerobaculia bacterium]